MRANTQAVVGAFVLGGLVLLLAAVLLFGKFDFFHPSVQAVVVFKDSINGLSVGAPVTFRGVRVGSVESISIEFDPKTKIAYIPVTVRLLPNRAPGATRDLGEAEGLRDLFARGLRAELNLQSFVTGQSEIDLDFDPSSPAVRHPDITTLPEIPVRESSLQRATAQLTELPLRELADNTNAALRSLRALTDRLNQDLPPLMDSLKAASDRSGQAVATADQAIRDLQGHLDMTLSAIMQVAETGTQQLSERGDDLHTVLAESSQTMRQVSDLLNNLKTMTSDRSASRTNLEATLRDLAAATASLRGFANDVEHNPQLLLTGRRP